MARNKKPRQRQPEDIIQPTLERGQHQEIRRLDKPISDEIGRVSRPYRAVDTLGAMLARGSIDEEMHASGERFRDDFGCAHLEALKAADLSRPFVSGRSANFSLSDAVGDAKNRVWDAMIAAGGPGSAGGECVWHVLGHERTLKEWSFKFGWRGRSVSQEAASGILISALGALKMHYQKMDKAPALSRRHVSRPTVRV